MSKYMLEPYNDSRKSFYGKAVVFEDRLEYGLVKRLFSYETEVAKITFNGEYTTYEYYGYYSQTTSRHQKEFFLQEGLDESMYNKLKKEGKIKL